MNLYNRHIKVEELTYAIYRDCRIPPVDGEFRNDI